MQNYSYYTNLSWYERQFMTNQSISTVSESPSQHKLQWGTIAFFAVFHGLALLAPWCFSWSALAIAIFFHWLFGSIGICLGYHRLLAHRSFQVPKWLEYIVATLGVLALQGGPIFWVSGHRRHHAYTEDKEKDPYSGSSWVLVESHTLAFLPQTSVFRLHYLQKLCS